MAINGDAAFDGRVVDRCRCHEFYPNIQVRHAELVSASIVQRRSVLAEKWTLKRVQGDVGFKLNL
jgi:hypothetical protein